MVWNLSGSKRLRPSLSMFPFSRSAVHCDLHNVRVLAVHDLTDGVWQ